MFFPEKLTCMWLKQAYKNGLKPEELIDEIIKRTEMYKDYHIWIVKPTMEILKQYFEKLPADRESLLLLRIILMLPICQRQRLVQITVIFPQKTHLW